MVIIAKCKSISWRIYLLAFLFTVFPSSFLPLFVLLCLSVHTHAMVCMWKPEDNLEEPILHISHVCSRDGAETIFFNSINHLTDPLLFSCSWFSYLFSFTGCCYRFICMNHSCIMECQIITFLPWDQRG